VITLDVAKAALMHRNTAKAFAKNTVKSKVLAASRTKAANLMKTGAKAVQTISDNAGTVKYTVNGIILFLENEIGRIEENIRKRINVIMFRIFSYITFGIRNYAEIRKMSYYSYVKSF
jgi:hypothetical protein